MKIWSVTVHAEFVGELVIEHYKVLAESQIAAIELGKGRAIAEGYHNPAVSMATEDK